MIGRLEYTDSAIILAAQSHNARGVGLCYHPDSFFLWYLSSWPCEPEHVQPITHEEVPAWFEWFKTYGIVFKSDIKIEEILGA